MRSYRRYFEGPSELEPNDSYLQANGPLRFDKDYHGIPGSDDWDYFSLDVDNPGRITVDLTSYVPQDGQLHLYYGTPSGKSRVGYAGVSPYHIDYDGQPGQYYILVYTAPGNGSSTAYILRAHFQ